MAKVTGNEQFKANMNRKDDGLTAMDFAKYKFEVDDVLSRFPAVMDEMEELLSRKFAHIYAVGIGNSLYAPESLKFRFRENSGINIDVFETHEFNNYYVNYMPENSLVIICSHGGAAARTVETAFVAKKRGATTLSLTCKPESRLNNSVENRLCLTQHDKKAYIWGNDGYQTLALMFSLLGIRMGKLHGHLTDEQVKEATEELRRAAYVGFETCMLHDDLIVKVAENTKDKGKVYFLGAGPNYIMTEFGGAKIMEQTAFDGIHQQMEEYGHQQYWVHNRRGNGDLVILLAPKGPSVQRAIENLREHKFLGLNTLVITTKDSSEELKALATYVIETPVDVPENLFAMVTSNVLARFANRLALAIGNMGERFATQNQQAEHYVTIHYSRFCDEVAEFDIPMPDTDTIESVGMMGLDFSKK